MYDKMYYIRNFNVCRMKVKVKSKGLWVIKKIIFKVLR